MRNTNKMSMAKMKALPLQLQLALPHHPLPHHLAPLLLLRLKCLDLPLHQVFFVIYFV
jgi:hypothetical protein